MSHTTIIISVAPKTTASSKSVIPHSMTTSATVTLNPSDDMTPAQIGDQVGDVIRLLEGMQG